MKTTFYARKERQLKFLVKRLKHLIAEAPDHREVIDQVKAKIYSLLRSMAGAFPKAKAQYILGSFAVIFGLSAMQKAEAQSFYPGQVNPFGLTPAYDFAFPEFADLDGDGDQDMLVGQYYGSIAFYENTGTAAAPAFEDPTDNPFGIGGGNAIALPAMADLDGDGDLDLLVGTVGYYSPAEFYYQENTGTASAPQFGAVQVNPFGLSGVYLIGSPTFADFDGDGDFDMIAGEYYGDLIYFENTGSATNPSFASPVTNPFGLPGTYYYAFPEAADLDNDGDIDLLVGEYYGEFMYFENTGSATNPAFGTGQSNPFGLQPGYYIASAAIADLDGDGDLDVMIGEYYGNFTFYSNSEITSVENLSANVDFDVYPNPASNEVRITTDQTIDRIEIVDITGKQIQMQVGPQQVVDVSNLNAGFYILKATLINDAVVTRRIEVL